MEREYHPKPLAEETEQNLGNQPVRLLLQYGPPLFEKQTTMNFPEKIWRGIIKPKFRDPSALSPEQLTDPDYRLKQIEELNRGKFSMIKWSCSRCHHCR
ncbi:MAG: hypothetical protein Q8N55_00735 [bacterium]|nr:hypothetical protein [bacterium]